MAASADDDDTAKGPFRFSTDDLPETERLAIWREVIGRAVAHLDVAPLDNGRFRSESTTLLLPNLSITYLSAENIKSQRTRELIADGNDDILLMLANEGEGLISQFGREMKIDGTTAGIISNAETSSAITPRLTGVSLRIPRKALLPIISKLDDAFLRPLPRDSEALRLLTSYVDFVKNMREPPTSALRQIISTHVHDLLSLIIGVPQDKGLPNSSSVRAARLLAIQSDVLKNIGTEELSTEWIAARHGVSASTVRRLFEEHQTTFSQWVLRSRLNHAYSLLCDPRIIDRTISSIAFASGFSDLSYFNRTFRRLYGLTPSDARESTIHERKKNI